MRRVARLLRLCPFTTIWTASFLVLVVGELLNQRVGLGAIPVVPWLLQILVIPAYLSALAVLFLANQLFGSVEAMPAWFQILFLPLRVLPFIALDLGLAAWRYITDRPLTAVGSIVALLALAGLEPVAAQAASIPTMGFPNIEASRLIAPESAGYVRKTPPTRAVIRRMWDEETHRTQISILGQYLADVIGPRPTGSPAQRKASDWAIARSD